MGSRREFTIEPIRFEQRVELDADAATRAWIRNDAMLPGASLGHVLVSIVELLHLEFVHQKFTPMSVHVLAAKFGDMLRRALPDEDIHVRVLPARIA